MSCKYVKIRNRFRGKIYSQELFWVFSCRYLNYAKMCLCEIWKCVICQVKMCTCSIMCSWKVSLTRTSLFELFLACIWKCNYVKMCLCSNNKVKYVRVLLFELFLSSLCENMKMCSWKYLKVLRPKVNLTRNSHELFKAFKHKCVYVKMWTCVICHVKMFSCKLCKKFCVHV